MHYYWLFHFTTTYINLIHKVKQSMGQLDKRKAARD